MKATIYFTNGNMCFLGGLYCYDSLERAIRENKRPDGEIICHCLSKSGRYSFRIK